MKADVAGHRAPVLNVLAIVEDWPYSRLSISNLFFSQVNRLALLPVARRCVTGLYAHDFVVYGVSGTYSET
jgi:hypothetical protein